jgi:hypothetical protein
VDEPDGRTKPNPLDERRNVPVTVPPDGAEAFWIVLFLPSSRRSARINALIALRNAG